MLQALWSNVIVWRVLAALLLTGVAGTSAWHAWQDHAALHQMIGYWNTYGPLLERARQATHQQSPVQTPAPRKETP